MRGFPSHSSGPQDPSSTSLCQQGHPSTAPIGAQPGVVPSPSCAHHGQCVLLGPGEPSQIPGQQEEKSMSPRIVVGQPQ